MGDLSLRKSLRAVPLATFLALLPAMTAAATFTVNSNGDAGDASPGNGICATAAAVCTLRAAIDEANALAGADAISVPPMTIVVGSPLPVTERVAITGAGRFATVIDGGNTTQVFRFVYDIQGSISDAASTLARVSILRGRAPTGNGGGIFNDAALKLSDVMVAGCHANNGGGIYGELLLGRPVGGVLDLESVELSGNSAGRAGGGLFIGDTGGGRNVTIAGNTAAEGGGLYGETAFTISLDGFEIRDNTAGEGGGVFAVNTGAGSLTLVNGTITDNEATADAGHGGGLHAMISVMMRRVTVARNTASRGAGIYNNMGLTLQTVTISGNRGRDSASVPSEGGGVYIDTGATTTVATNVTITSNEASLAGGISNRSTSTAVALRNSVLSGNVAMSGSPDCLGQISSGGFNIVGSSSGCTFGAGEEDLIGASPLLDSRRGFPGHHPIRPDSPAFNTGSNSFSAPHYPCPTPDARGLGRPQGGVCDRGAFELGDLPVVGDWDGNGSTTIGIYRPWESACYLKIVNVSGVNDIPAFLYGAPDTLVVGDWDGDGVDTIGVFRSSENAWYLRSSNTSGINDTPAFRYGADGDVPVVGDWDGDGTTTIGIYRPSEHAWYLRNSNTSGFNDIPAILYGADGDIPVVGDWDGDGTDTIGVYRPSERVWYLRSSNSGGVNDIPAILYGDSNDLPVVGDWDANGTTTIGVYRLTDRIWYLRNSNTSGVNDIPPAWF